ncbi:uncharacterized protein LOC114330403 isoform X2 [Diabrotica virgifera virgifera]|uniref:MADF domain-containing protein n=1 Tax=Diabrotica virgifera virgifera TaxID=50390 RepID=A0ABM5JPA5_DIAVI|nr:uncharacterized protein LOC114330403 isoform X2 [Diabrotica virgifera virgifera]
MSIPKGEPVKIGDGDGVLRNFIATYEELPLLWNPTDPSYKNKIKRNAALTKLLSIYKNCKPGATIGDVRRKINTLRCNYRKELKKIEDSKKSGAGADDIYSPTSWVFHALKFINQLEQPVILGNSQAQVNEEQNDEDNEDSSQIMANNSSLSSIVPPHEPTLKRARSSKTTNEQQIPHIAIAWGEKLLQLDPQQRNLAEKAINDVLFEASQGTLHRHSVKINDGFSYPSSTVTSPVSSVDIPAYGPSQQDQGSLKLEPI